MTRHSKVNTKLGYFTSHEKHKIKQYGTIKQRLDKNSIKNFDDCSVCLKQAVNPVCCDKGHMFCRECILTNILNQKRKIKENKKMYRKSKLELRKKSESEKQTKTEKDIKQFNFNNNVIVPVDKNLESNGNNDKLSCFWVPSLTPDNKKVAIAKPDKTKIDILCPGNPGKEKITHCIKMSKLANVRFSIIGNEADKPLKYICKICSKTLSNLSKLAILRKCGHVFCKQCTIGDFDQNNCFVCLQHIECIWDLESGGSNFAAHGNDIEGKKYTLAFL